MGYAFLWLEAMASSLLLVTMVFACSGRLKKWPALWPILMTFLLAVPAIAAMVFAGYLFFENIHPQWLFPYTLSWTLLFIAGSWIQIRRGRRKSGEVLSAASWPRSKVGGALVIALALQWSTAITLDNTAKLEAAAIQTMAIAKARTVLPSAPPYHQNAAALYDKAATTFHPDQDQMLDEELDRILDDSTNPAFDPKSESAQKVLRDNKKAIDLIKVAVQKPRLYHPYTLDFEFIVFPRFVPFKDAARLLALEARSHARNGHTAAALENILSIDKIVEQINQTPLLINVLVAGSIQIRSKSALEIILAENSNRAKIKISLPIKTNDRILQTFKDGMVFEESLGGFSWANLVIRNTPIDFSDLESDELSDPWPPDDNLLNHFFSSTYRIFLFHDDKISHKRFWEKYHEYIKNPYYQSGIDLKEWEENLSENLDLGLFMALNSSSFGVYFKRVTQEQTQFLLSRLGLAAAAYHSDHSKYPEKLETLVPKYITEIPIDPFSGEPLKMIAVKGGLILYGVGENLKDNKGMSHDKETDEGDIAFYLGSAFKEHRLKPALEKMENEEAE